MEIFSAFIYAVGTVSLAFVIHLTFSVSKLVQQRWQSAENLKEFAGPAGNWFLGNMRQVLSHPDLTDFTMSLVQKYPKICKIRVDPFDNFLVAYHPETIKTVASTAEPKADEYRALEPWIGDGLLISKGAKWARNRRLLSPAFHFDILKPYVTVFSQSANTMTEKWRCVLLESNEPLELFVHVSLMMLDSLMKCILGLQEDFQAGSTEHNYIKNVNELSDLFTKRLLFFPYYNDVIYNLTWSGYKFRRACHLVHKCSRDIISRKRREKSLSAGEQSLKKYLSFMDILLDAKDEDGRGLTDAEIQAEVDTFMFEGHDTTASGMSWCLYNLARHPEYQAKCRDEVNNVLGHREQFSWDDVHSLPFLTMCIKENLRLYPPVPVVRREITKSLTFKDGRTIPAGTLVELNIYGCHHNPDVWENPEVYDPYRFTPENSMNRSPYAFMPFSAGPRNCIGQNFALHEMKVAIGQVIRHFQLSEVPDRPPKKQSLMILRAVNGLYVKATPL